MCVFIILKSEEYHTLDKHECVIVRIGQNNEVEILANELGLV